MESLALADVVCLQWSLLVEGIQLPISLINPMLQDSSAGESVLGAWGEQLSAFKVSVVSQNYFSFQPGNVHLRQFK